MDFQKKVQKSQKKIKKGVDFSERGGYKPVCRRDEARLKKTDEERCGYKEKVNKRFKRIRRRFYVFTNCKKNIKSDCIK